MEIKSFYLRRCVFVLYLMMSPVNLQIPMGPVGYPMPMPMQMPMPMPMPPPMYAMPAPPPMPIGVPVPIPMLIGGNGNNGNGNGFSFNRPTTTTTTTTEPSKDVQQIPLPVEISIFPSNSKYPRFYPAPFPGPPPAPFPMPAPFPPPAPFLPPPPFPGPYPPPAYGAPLPMPMMPPPPLVYLRPKKRRKKPVVSEESCSYETTPKPKHDCAKKRAFRRMLRSDEIYDNELVKPVLTYVSRDGDVKLKQRLSNDEAVDLMDDNRSFRNFKIVAGEDSQNRQRVLMVSNNDRSLENTNHRRRQIVLRPGSSQYGLGEGRKELIFRPPSDKKISNLSVSFKISDR